MPRHPDPDLEERVLKAADALWKRGGEQALTMRAVARAAGTNTPAVYRRFKDREDLLHGLLLRIAERIRVEFAQGGEDLEQMADTYVEFALRHPNEYELFYTHARLMSPRRGRGALRPIRDSRPNFALVEKLMAKQWGGTPDDHTLTALALWAVVHGTSMMLLSKTIPEGHEGAMREACRRAVKTLLGEARRWREKS